MINNIFIDNKLVIDLNKSQIRKQYYLLIDNTKVFNIRNLKQYSIQIECHNCSRLCNIKTINKYHLEKGYYCMSCGRLGDRNGFFGKKHTQELKDKFSKERKNLYIGDKNPMYNISVYEKWVTKYGKEQADILESERRRNMSIKMSGESNPFFGKKHDAKTMKKIKEANLEYRKNLTEDNKNEISNKLSVAQRENQSKDPIKYKQNKIKAAKKSAQSQSKYKINNIETIVRNELFKRNINMEYCVILGFHQFDFGNKENKILLEVQGDYWHGNPTLYQQKNLNSTQINKQNKDKIKAEFAQKHGFKLFYIWENDINNGNFEILDSIAKITV